MILSVMFSQFGCSRCSRDGLYSHAANKSDLMTNMTTKIRKKGREPAFFYLSLVEFLPRAFSHIVLVSPLFIFHRLVLPFFLALLPNSTWRGALSSLAQYWNFFSLFFFLDGKRAI